MKDFGLKDRVGVGKINFKDGTGLFVTFTEHKEDKRQDFYSATAIKLSPISGSDEALILEVEGSINPQVAPDIYQINVKHETVVAWAGTMGVGTIFSNKGINLLQPFLPQLQKKGIDYKIIQEFWSKASSTIAVYAKVSAQIRDIILLLKVIDKDTKGEPLFIPDSNQKNLVLIPTINGTPFTDNGRFKIAWDSSIAKILAQFDDIDQLQSVYKDFRQIPYWDDFEKNIIGR